MTPAEVLDLCNHALMVSLVIAAPILLIGLVIGLVISLVQAVTQLQEQTLSFVPKMVAMVAAGAFFLPWLTTRLVEYATQSWSSLF